MQATTSSPAPTTFTDKARHLAGQGMDFANTQKLSLQQNASFARLGKAIYECDDHALAPADIRTPIDTLHSRLKEIDKELATHKGVWSATGQGLSPLILGASVLLFWPVGLFLLWRHPTLSRNRGWWAAGITWALLVMVAAGRTPGSRPTQPSSDSTSRTEESSKVTEENYKAIEEGMTKGDVDKILGAPEKRILADGAMTSYVWKGNGIRIIITFRGVTVFTKAKTALKD